MNDIEAQLKAAGAENVYLIVTDGCPFCESLKEQLNEYIEGGLVEVKSIDTDDEAVDILANVETNDLPKIIVKTQDGDYMDF